MKIQAIKFSLQTYIDWTSSNSEITGFYQSHTYRTPNQEALMVKLLALFITQFTSNLL